MQIISRRALLGVLLLALSFTTSTASGQQPEKKPLAVEDLYKFDAPRDAALAPDGNSLVFVRQWIDAKQKVDRFSLWRVDGDAATAKPMEKDEPDARAPVYSPDGKWIAFLSTRSRPTGWSQTPQVPPQSDPATDVWLIPATGGVAVPLTGREKPHGRVFNDGFYGRLAFSPDGSKLAFVADDGKDPRTAAEKTNGVTVVREDQGEGYTGYGPAQIWLAHLDPNAERAAGKIERLTDDNVWYGDPNWHPNGKTLALHANRTADRESARFSINKNFDIFLLDVTTRRFTQATSGPGPDVSPRFSPDGKKLACLSVPRKGSHRDAFNIGIIGLSSTKTTAGIVFDHHATVKGFPPHGVPLFPLPVDCWDGDTFLLIPTEDGLRNRLARIAIANGVSEEFTPVAPKGGAAPKTPGERLTRRNQLTPPGNTFLKERLIAPQKVISWKSDEFTIEGILTLPPESITKPPYKLLVYPHGGPHSRSTLGFDFTLQLFAANGYAVFQPNFRGSSGYGQKFIDADRGDFGGGDMRDILTGVDKLVADKLVDKDRLFVYGTSYGGFMTTWLVGQTHQFRAAVAQNAVTDLNMMWSLSDIPSWTEWEFGGKPWEVPEKYRKYSPLTYVDKVKTPILLLHARDDRRCPLPMGRAYYAAVKDRGIPTDLVIYPGEGHGIRQPRHREDVLCRVLDWFAKYDKK